MRFVSSNDSIMIPFIEAKPRNVHGRRVHSRIALINYAPKPIRSSTESHARPITRLTGWKRNYSREVEHRQQNSMHGIACVENSSHTARHTPHTLHLTPHTSHSISYFVRLWLSISQVKKKSCIFRTLHGTDRSKVENMHRDCVPCAMPTCSDYSLLCAR